MAIENIIKNGLQSWLFENNGTKIIEKRSIVLKTPTFEKSFISDVADYTKAHKETMIEIYAGKEIFIAINGKHLILPRRKQQLAMEAFGA